MPYTNKAPEFHFFSIKNIEKKRSRIGQKVWSSLKNELLWQDGVLKAERASCSKAADAQGNIR